MSRPAPEVVVITHRGGPLLARCVDALQRQTCSPGTIRVVLSAAGNPPLPTGVEILRLGKNVGFAKAANAGLQSVARGPVVLLNDDTEPEPGFLAALCDAAESGGPGIYQPHIVLAGDPERLDNTGHRLFPDGFNLRAAAGGQTSPRRPVRLAHFLAPRFLFTPEVIEQVGLFDADLEASGGRGPQPRASGRVSPSGTYPPHASDMRWARPMAGPARGEDLPRGTEPDPAAVRSLPTTALLTMPAWTGPPRLARDGGRRRQGRGATAGPRGAAAAAVGALAGLRSVPDALRKRNADRAGWVVGERGMWTHLLMHAVRPADLLAPRP